MHFAGAEKNPPLQQAYAKLRSVAETRPTVDAPDPFGQDLFVQCAEIAFQVRLFRTSIKIINVSVQY